MLLEPAVNVFMTFVALYHARGKETVLGGGGGGGFIAKKIFEPRNILRLRK